MHRSDKQWRGWMWISTLAVLVSVCGASGAAWARPKARKPPPPTATEAAPEPAGEAAPSEPLPDAPLAAQPDQAQAAPEEPPPTAAEATAPAVAPESPPDSEAKAAAAEADAQELEALSTELSALMDDLVQARARAALLGKTLFKTRINVQVQNLAEDSASLGKLVLKLDGAPIYRGDGSVLRGDEPHQVFDGYVAPGAHVLSAEVEQNSRADSAYGYALRESYRFVAVREKSNQLTLVLADDSDVASEFPDEQEGEYDIRTKLRVRTDELSER